MRTRKGSYHRWWHSISALTCVEPASFPQIHTQHKPLHTHSIPVRHTMYPMWEAHRLLAAEIVQLVCVDEKTHRWFPVVVGFSCIHLLCVQAIWSTPACLAVPFSHQLVLEMKPLCGLPRSHTHQYRTPNTVPLLYTCMNTHTQTYTHVYTHTHTHSLTQTFINTQSCLHKLQNHVDFPHTDKGMQACTYTHIYKHTLMCCLSQTVYRANGPRPVSSIHIPHQKRETKCQLYQQFDSHRLFVCFCVSKCVCVCE